jgi:hypothetical protein
MYGSGIQGSCGLDFGFANDQSDFADDDETGDRAVIEADNQASFLCSQLFGRT